MDVPLITLPRVEALKKVAAYQRAMRRSKNPELAAAEAGYSALAKGRALLDLNQAVAAGGWTPEGHPRFAVARADRREVRYRVNGLWLQFDATSDLTHRGGPSLHRSVSLGARPPGAGRDSWKVRAMVPLIPADVREVARKAASARGERSWFILWEAVWEPVPPVDPILLEHLAGSLYVVLAQWNLTELERALMAGRLTGA